MNIEDLRIDVNPMLIRDYALDKIRAAIATGLYPPGVRLVERELCEALGVSRTSVREALRQLQAESLIEAGARRSIIVAKISAEDAFDIYTLREMIETTAIRRLVKRNDPKTIKRLQLAVRAIEKNAAKGDLPALVEMAGAFYEEILKGSGSRVLSDSGGQLLKRVSYLRLTSMSAPKRIESGIAEWSKIIDAVVQRDADAAAEALTTHIRNSRDSIVAQLNKADD